MKALILNISIAFACISLIGCKPTFTRKYDLQYEVIKLDADPVTYSVIFTDGNGKTVSLGPFSDGHWKSEVYKNVSSGREVSFEVNVKNGGSDLDIRILRDGETHHQGTLLKPQSKVTIDAVL